MDDNKLLHLLDLAYMGYPDAVKALSENYGRLYDVVAEGSTAKEQLDSYETALNERDSTIYDLEGEIGTLERAILTLEEELSEAREALDEALDEIKTLNDKD